MFRDSEAGSLATIESLRRSSIGLNSTIESLSDTIERKNILHFYFTAKNIEAYSYMGPRDLSPSYKNVSQSFAGDLSLICSKQAIRFLFIIF